MESKEQKIGKWERFIAVDKNKASLTNFLSTEISRTYHPQPGRELVLSGGFFDISEVWSSCETRYDFSGLASNHEEADTRLFCMPEMQLLTGTSRLTLYVMIQMSSSFYLHIGNFSVQLFGCSRELLNARNTFQFTEFHCPMRKGVHCYHFMQ